MAEAVNATRLEGTAQEEQQPMDARANAVAAEERQQEQQKEFIEGLGMIDGELSNSLKVLQHHSQGKDLSSEAINGILKAFTRFYNENQLALFLNYLMKRAEKTKLSENRVRAIEGVLNVRYPSLSSGVQPTGTAASPIIAIQTSDSVKEKTVSPEQKGRAAWRLLRNSRDIAASLKNWMSDLSDNERSVFVAALLEEAEKAEASDGMIAAIMQALAPVDAERQQEEQPMENWMERGASIAEQNGRSAWGLLESRSEGNLLSSEEIEESLKCWINYLLVEEYDAFYKGVSKAAGGVKIDGNMIEALRKKLNVVDREEQQDKKATYDTADVTVVEETPQEEQPMDETANIIGFDDYDASGDAISWGDQEFLDELSIPLFAKINYLVRHKMWEQLNSDAKLDMCIKAAKILVKHETLFFDNQGNFNATALRVLRLLGADFVQEIQRSLNRDLEGGYDSLNLPNFDRLRQNINAWWADIFSFGQQNNVVMNFGPNNGTEPVGVGNGLGNAPVKLILQGGQEISAIM